jgi:hypothetical protein
VPLSPSQARGLSERQNIQALVERTKMESSFDNLRIDVTNQSTHSLTRMSLTRGNNPLM